MDDDDDDPRKSLRNYLGPDSMYEADQINCSQLGNGPSSEAKGRLFYCKMTIIFNIWKENNDNS